MPYPYTSMSLRLMYGFNVQPYQAVHKTPQPCLLCIDAYYSNAARTALDLQILQCVEHSSAELQQVDLTQKDSIHRAVQLSSGYGAVFCIRSSCSAR